MDKRVMLDRCMTYLRNEEKEHGDHALLSLLIKMGVIKEKNLFKYDISRRF